MEVNWSGSIWDRQLNDRLSKLETKTSTFRTLIKGVIATRNSFDKATIKREPLVKGFRNEDFLGRNLQTYFIRL